MSVLPVDDVTSQAGGNADLLIGDRFALRPALAFPSCPGGSMCGAACGVSNEHQQLDPAQGVYGAAGRAGQELDAIGTLNLVGLLREVLDFGGEHVDVVRQREPLLLVVANGTAEHIEPCWLQPTISANSSPRASRRGVTLLLVPATAMSDTSLT
ncbi:hypothetical protein ID875_21150 [Streptomyces globisporus]|uniref:Uncharacterized protein n=1 Tax=Streptomyces globisporus TaxID=1908 RepID=A0A927GNY8_STRGL|nr:hypothetical protein [Streptomyces globisporus]